MTQPVQDVETSRLEAFSDGVGSMWVNHHSMFRNIVRTDRVLPFFSFASPGTALALQFGLALYYLFEQVRSD